MRRWVGMTTTTTRRGLRRGLRPRRRQQPLRQRTRLPTCKSRAWHGQHRPLIRLSCPLSSMQRPCRRCCRSCRNCFPKLHRSSPKLLQPLQWPLQRLRQRLRRCLGSWSSRCLVWLRLTTLANLCLVAGEVGQVGLARLAMLVVEVVGLLVVVVHPRPRRPLPRRWGIPPRVALPEHRRLTRTRTRRRTRTTKCPCQTRHSIRLVRYRLRPLQTAQRSCQGAV